MSGIEGSNDSVGVETELGEEAIGLGVGEELRGHAQNVDQASFIATMDFGGDRHPDATLANEIGRAHV